MNPYKVLGVKKTDKEKVIRKAYQQLAKSAHPDMPGGSEEKFLELKRAHDLLLDPLQRDIYDRHGFVSGWEGCPGLQEAAMHIKNMIVSMLQKCTPEQLAQTELITMAKTAIRSDKDKCEENLIALKLQQKQLEGHEKVLKKRLKCKTEANLFLDALKATTMMLVHQQHNMENAQRILLLALELLDDYEYTAEVMKQMSSIYSTNTAFFFNVKM